jgi:hypothetical protein
MTDRETRFVTLLGGAMASAYVSLIAVFLFGSGEVIPGGRGLYALIGISAMAVITVLGVILIARMK